MKTIQSGTSLQDLNTTVMLALSKTKALATFCKLQKLNDQIITMRRNGMLKRIPFYKRASLYKRYKRYLKNLISVKHPVSKAMGLFDVAMLLSAASEAQTTCRRYKDAFESNPLKRLPLTNDLFNPAFADIDADGDMDCYAIYRVADDNPSTYDSLRFSLLKNVGTSTFPVFEPGGTGGFPAAPDLSYVGFFPQEGPVFADIDGDGDYDCFLANYTSRGDYRFTVEYFENTGDATNPVFVQRPRDEHPLSFVTGYRALLFNLVDIDLDGDYDLLTFESYYDKFYLNKGTKNNPDFVFVRDDRVYGFSNPYFNHYVFIDWNKDGLIDAVPTGGGVYYTYKGAGEGHHFITANYSDAPIFTGIVKASAMVDLNNDGFPETVGHNLDYAIVSPVVTIKATNGNASVKLDAYPKGAYTYQWLKDGEMIEGATGDFIVVSQPGGYTAEVTGVCGTGISLPYVFESGSAPVSSIQNLSASGSKNIHLQVYPNPFADGCVLKFDGAITGNTIVHVTDAQGKLVVSVNAVNNIVSFGKELKSGIYFVQVIQNNTVIHRQKIIKQ
jgi:hypothetical protein